MNNFLEGFFGTFAIIVAVCSFIVMVTASIDNSGDVFESPRERWVAFLTSGFLLCCAVGSFSAIIS